MYPGNLTDVQWSKLELLLVLLAAALRKWVCDRAFRNVQEGEQHLAHGSTSTTTCCLMVTGPREDW
jgi:hypothetical protein